MRFSVAEQFAIKGDAQGLPLILDSFFEDGRYNTADLTIALDCEE